MMTRVYKIHSVRDAEKAPYAQIWQLKSDDGKQFLVSVKENTRVEVLKEDPKRPGYALIVRIEED